MSLHPLTLAAYRLRFLAHHGMEEVRGSSPLSSTAKVLVKAYLILKDAWLSYATEGHQKANGHRSAQKEAL
jgi:hypothetical protein